MFVFYDWPFTHMCRAYYAKNAAYFPFNSWLSFQRLCRLLWGLLFSRPLCERSAGDEGLCFAVIFIPAKARDYVFTGVGLSVCLF